MILGRIDARRDDYDLAGYAAWKNEWFRRQEVLEPFGTYAPKNRQPEGDRQTPQEMLASLASRASSGAPIRMELVDAPRPRSAQ